MSASFKERLAFFQGNGGAKNDAPPRPSGGVAQKAAFYQGGGGAKPPNGKERGTEDSQKAEAEKKKAEEAKKNVEEEKKTAGTRPPGRSPASCAAAKFARFQGDGAKSAAPSSSASDAQKKAEEE